MSSWIVLVILGPLFLQSNLMVWDEFYFHQRRGLGPWERWGHPLDTLTVILPLSLVWFVSWQPIHVVIYAGLAFFSCLFVTKDEFVHHRLCEPKEQWLHALLFVMHPVVFLALAVFWFFRDQLAAQNSWVWGLAALWSATLVGFLIYQVVYWNFWKVSDAKHHQ